MAECCASLVAGMNKRVIIQNPVQVSDSQGGYTETFPDVATISASIEPVKAWERYQAGQMQTPVTHKLVCRYRDDITTASRLKFGTRVFWVREVINENENNRFLIIKAIERA